jgi:hypothetical protein
MGAGWSGVTRRFFAAVTAVTTVVLVATGSAFGFGLFHYGGTVATGGSVFGVATGDVNGDGKADAIVSNDDGDDHISLLLGKGNGTFKPETRIDDPDGPEGVVMAKLNGDARPDFAVANYDGNAVQVFLQKAGGDFKAGDPLPAGPGSWLLRRTDLNGDGKADLVAGNYSTVSSADAVSVLLGNGDGTFDAAKNYDGCDSAGGLAVARMNADKRPDVIESCVNDGSLSIFPGRKGGKLGPPEMLDFQDTIGLGWGVATGDFNRDHKKDVAVPLNDGSIELFHGNGDGTVEAPVLTQGSDTSTNGIGAGDFNGDGKVDLAVGRSEDPFGMSTIRGNGDGTFRAPKSYDGNDVGESVVVGRLNGDKGRDVIVGTDSGIDVFLNKP